MPRSTPKQYALGTGTLGAHETARVSVRSGLDVFSIGNNVPEEKLSDPHGYNSTRLVLISTGPLCHLQQEDVE